MFSGEVEISWKEGNNRFFIEAFRKSITDLLLIGNCGGNICGPTMFECPMSSESSLTFDKKLELESSGARSRENDRLKGNSLSIVGDG